VYVGLSGLAPVGTSASSEERAASTKEVPGGRGAARLDWADALRTILTVSGWVDLCCLCTFFSFFFLFFLNHMIIV